MNSSPYFFRYAGGRPAFVRFMLSGRMSSRLSRYISALLWGLLSTVLILPAHAGLAEVEKEFQVRYRSQVGAKHDAAVKQLKDRYLAILDREGQKARKEGLLEDALALKTEQDSVRSGQFAPVVKDAPPTPPALERLRELHARELDKLDASRQVAVQPLVNAFDAKLVALQTEMTKTGKLEEALKVREYREGDLASMLTGAADSSLIPTLRKAMKGFDEDCQLYYSFNQKNAVTDGSKSGNHAKAVKPEWIVRDPERGSVIDLSLKGAGIVSKEPLKFKGNEPRTFCAWVKIHSLEQFKDFTATMLFSTGKEERASGSRFTVLVQGESRKVFIHGHGRDHLMDPLMPVGQWVHFAVTYDSKEVTTYLNGKVAARQGYDLVTVESSLSIGRCEPMVHFYAPWNGLVDDFIVFGKALKEDEIRLIKDAG